MTADVRDQWDALRTGLFQQAGGGSHAHLVWERPGRAPKATLTRVDDDTDLPAGLLLDGFVPRLRDTPPKIDQPHTADAGLAEQEGSRNMDQIGIDAGTMQEPSHTGLHQAALALASDGWAVFPLIPGTKKPLAGSNGLHDATGDPDQINRWWNESPECNIGLSMDGSGVTVIDTDPPDGEANWAALQDKYGQGADTYTVQSPRGGLHRYYLGELPPSTGKLAPHIDVRGSRSYVLAPPSRTPDGWYVVLGGTMAPLPAWVAQVLAERSVKAVAEAPADVALDLPGNVFRAETWLALQPVLIEGEGSDEGAFVWACQLRDFAISQERTLELIAARQPEFDREWIEEKVNNAFRYAQNAPGVYAADDPEVIFAEALKMFRALAEPGAEPERATGDGKTDVERRRDRYRWFTEADIPSLPPVRVAVNGLLFEGAGTYLLSGALGAYKTFAAGELALALTSGRPCFGTLPVHGEPGPVAWFIAEGSRTLMTRRWPALRYHRGIPPDQRLPVFFNRAVPPLLQREDVEHCKDQIRAIKRQTGRAPRLIIFDTLARMHEGLSENDATSATLYIRMAEDIANEFDCAVWTNAHTGKNETQGTRGTSGFEANTENVYYITADPLDARTATNPRWAKIAPHRLKDAPEWGPICLAGKRIIIDNDNRGLALDGIGEDAFREHQGAGKTADSADWSAQLGIAASLREAGAYGAEHSLSTRQLVEWRSPDPKTCEPAERETEIAKEVDRLDAGSRDRHGKGCRFEGYFEKVAWPLGAPGSRLAKRWFLPSDEATT